MGRREAPHAVRIAISTSRARGDVRRALVTIAGLVAGEPGAETEVL